MPVSFDFDLHLTFDNMNEKFGRVMLDLKKALMHYDMVAQSVKDKTWRQKGEKN